jgi:hypothetical protein
MGYVVKQASNATEALEIMFAEPASIILRDCRTAPDTWGV